MPNWCSNTIEIVGPRDLIRNIWAELHLPAHRPKGLLQALCPMPSSLEDTEADGSGMPNWYSWRVENWGTKWDIDTDELEFEEDSDEYENPCARIVGWFDSAWSPPVEAFRFFAEHNPDVRIHLDYHEGGMTFVGRAEFENGAMLLDECTDYGGYSSDTVRDAIGEHLDDMFGISDTLAEYEEEEEEDFWADEPKPEDYYDR